MKAKLRDSLYLLSLTPALMVVLGNMEGGIFTLSNIFYSLIFWGILEWLLPASTSNLHSKRDAPMPKFILIMHIPFQFASVASLFLGILLKRIDGFWIIAAALSTGLNSGSSAIVVAHEFIHRKSKRGQAMGKLLLFSAGNVYFFIEHLRVHHKWFGTQKDHATARFGESLYHFFLRTVREQFKGALRLEAERLGIQNIHPYSINNYVIRQVVLQILVIVTLTLFFGVPCAIAWVIQCFLANFLLEYINYIQHYGLVRDEKQRGNEEHSWESDHFASRFVLVDLSRHADHHYYAAKPYHTLINYENAPKLPSGYSGLFVFAMVPVFWRKLIHPILQQGKLNNLDRQSTPSN